jgi:hypothetical protein
MAQQVEVLPHRRSAGSIPAVSDILQADRAPATRSALRRLLGAALAAGIFSCAQAGSVPDDLLAGDVTGRVRVFCIAVEDAGQSGRKVGCNDSALPVEVSLPRPTAALEGSLAALLAIHQRFEPTTGLYNALYASPLTLQRIERTGTQAKVYLDGYLALGGTCDNARVLAQLQETALQFEDVQVVQFYLGGKPLRDLLAGKG